jgi:hypothetical protein
MSDAAPGHRSAPASGRWLLSLTRPRSKGPWALCGLAVAMISVGPLWESGPGLRGVESRPAELASLWPTGNEGVRADRGVPEPDRCPWRPATRDRYDLRLHLARPGGTPIATVECTYERSSWDNRERNRTVTVPAPAEERGRGVRPALVLAVVLLACVLLPERGR